MMYMIILSEMGNNQEVHWDNMDNERCCRDI